MFVVVVFDVLEWKTIKIQTVFYFINFGKLTVSDDMEVTFESS